MIDFHSTGIAVFPINPLNNSLDFYLRGPVPRRKWVIPLEFA
jgi:hypothetical protein